ncbi:MAG: cytochrome c biogenesis CcdA family protein [Acidimicrobiales bacterium]
MTAELSYAFALGLVAAVNPCGFPMLPAYLSFFVGAEGDGTGLATRLGRAVASSAAVAVGFVVVFAVLGALFRAGVTLFMAWVPWAMIVIGACLAGIGLLGLAGRRIPVPLPRLRLGSPGRTFGSMVGFGVSYALASLTCSLPIFLGGVAGAFTRVGVVTGMATFLAYAAGMAAVLCVVSLALALARTSVVSLLRRAGRHIERLASALLLLVGAYLVYYWVVDLYAPYTSTSLILRIDGFQATLARLVGGGQVEIAIGLAAALVAFGAFLVGRRRRAGGGLGRGPGGASGGELGRRPGGVAGADALPHGAGDG